MKKPKGNKKNKVKKKWSKQCGDFTFKNVHFGPSGQVPRISVFFKDEEFGFLNCTNGKMNKDSYSCNIFDFSGHFYLGKAECSGIIHQLPKKIEFVILHGETDISVLCPTRRVMTEKIIILDTKFLKIYQQIDRNS